MKYKKPSIILGWSLVCALVVCSGCSSRLDHFKVYEIEKVGAGYEVTLSDQFDTSLKAATLDTLRYFANPTGKIHGDNVVGIADSNRHFNGYSIIQQQPEPCRTIHYLTQFEEDEPRRVEIEAPSFLLVPAKKNGHTFPETLDHYKCYEVMDFEEQQPFTVTLKDQFDDRADDGRVVQVRNPRHFCTPVRKRWKDTWHSVRNADDHLAVYDIAPERQPEKIEVRDQFVDEEEPPRSLEVIRSVMLAVPSEKPQVEIHDCTG